MFKWRQATSSVPWRSLLGPTLLHLHIFVSDVSRDIEHILSNFTNTTKLCGAVNMLQGKDIIQRNYGRLER